MQRLINRLLPFVFVGIALVALFFGMIILVYLFLIGAVLGFIVFFVTLIRDKLFPPKTVVKPKEKSSGRIIDSDDWKKL